LNVAPQSASVDHFTQQDGPAVPEARDELSELMARVSGGNGIGALRHGVAREYACQRGIVEEAPLEPEFGRPSPVELDQAGIGDRNRV
jgi:hypothetical protein